MVNAVARDLELKYEVAKELRDDALRAYQDALRAYQDALRAWAVINASTNAAFQALADANAEMEKAYGAYVRAIVS